MEQTYKIGEAAALLNLKTYVLRFWETEFPQITPLRTEKGQRLYRAQDIELLERIRYLLHEQGLTIDGARKILDNHESEAFIPTSPLAVSIPSPMEPAQKNFPQSSDAPSAHNEEASAEDIEHSPVEHLTDSVLTNTAHAMLEKVADNTATPSLNDGPVEGISDTQKGNSPKVLTTNDQSPLVQQAVAPQVSAQRAPFQSSSKPSLDNQALQILITELEDIAVMLRRDLTKGNCIQ